MKKRRTTARKIRNARVQGVRPNSAHVVRAIRRKQGMRECTNGAITGRGDAAGEWRKKQQPERHDISSVISANQSDANQSKGAQRIYLLLHKGRK